MDQEKLFGKITQPKGLKWQKSDKPFFICDSSSSKPKNKKKATGKSLFYKDPILKN